MSLHDSEFKNYLIESKKIIDNNINNFDSEKRHLAIPKAKAIAKKMVENFKIFALKGIRKISYTPTDYCEYNYYNIYFMEEMKIIADEMNMTFTYHPEVSQMIFTLN